MCSKVFSSSVYFWELNVSYNVKYRLSYTQNNESILIIFLDYYNSSLKRIEANHKIQVIQLENILPTHSCYKLENMILVLKRPAVLIQTVHNVSLNFVSKHNVVYLSKVR
jgi:hypothetical protein